MSDLWIENGFKIFLRNFIHLKLDIITRQTDKYPEALIRLYKSIDEHNDKKLFDQSHRLTLDEYHSIKSFYLERNDKDSFRIFITSVIWAQALPSDFNDWEYPFKNTTIVYTIKSFNEKMTEHGHNYPF